MKRNIIIFTIALIIGVTFFSSPGFCDQQLNEYIDIFPCMELRIDAVRVEAALYLGWMFDEKEKVKIATEKAIADLENLKQELIEKKFPVKLINIRNEQIGVIDILADTQTYYLWGEKAKRYKPRSNYYLSVFKRRK